LLQNLALVGKIIDTTIKSGANRISGMQFTLQGEQSVRAQAETGSAASPCHR
jgi:uncharacterized protein YggE